MITDEHMHTDGSDRSAVPVAQQLIMLACILLLIFGSGYIPRLLDTKNDVTSEKTPDQQYTAQVTEPNHSDAEDVFLDTELIGQAAYVWDVQAQRALYKKNPDIQLPLASISKLMTALVAYELLEENAEVSISDGAIRQDGDSGFLQGESFALGNLLDFTLLSSSNDGAFAIAAVGGSLLSESGEAATFVEAMNIRAHELGLTHTYFRNPTGLDISLEEGGAYGSARDVTFLMEYILTQHPEILEATTKNEAAVANQSGGTHFAENTNPMTERIPGIIGSKTGYTDLAGGNLAVAFDVAFNRPVIVVVLGSTRNGRFEDVLNLADRTRAAIGQ